MSIFGTIMSKIFGRAETPATPVVPTTAVPELRKRLALARSTIAGTPGR